jgi:glycosyltransferase involved in cell wall biosynthesis
MLYLGLAFSDQTITVHKVPVDHELVIIIPTRDRPQNVPRVLASIRETTPDARVLFVVEPSDEATHRAVEAEGGEMLLVHGSYGGYAKKINRGIQATTEPLIFQGADDVIFHPGWFEAAKARLSEGIGVVGTNDLCSTRVMAGVHSAHALITREYTRRGTIDDPSRVLHEGYWHEGADDEFVQTAMARNAFAHAADSIVEHIHPAVGKAPKDAFYSKAGRRYLAGWLLLQWRRRLWT